MAIKVEVLQLGNSAPKLAGEKDGLYRTAVYISATSWAEDVTDAAAVLSRQSEQCRAYLKEHKELKKVETYADRNSVRDCRREWLRLLDDAECRKFDTVLTTSIRYVSESFSPACVDIGRFFYPAGIRFIAVEDGFDSSKDDMQDYLERCASMQSCYIGNKWMAEGFAKQKIYKAAVPYGYRYVADGNPQIVIDPETAPYVVKLFEMAVKKTPVMDMVRYMNDCKAPTPRQRRGQLYGEKVTGSPYWKHAVVKNILKNPCYVGDYVIGRTREIRIDGVQMEYEKLPPEKWKVIRNYHEPIISREIYQQSMDILEARSFTQTCKNRNYQNPYRNVFVCGCCGTLMTCNVAGVKNGKDYARIFCDSGRYQKDGGCETYDVRQDDVIVKMKEAFAAEIRLAKHLCESLPAVRESKAYQDALLHFDQEKLRVQSEIEMAVEDGDEAETLYRELKQVMAEKAQFENLFSTDNLWLQRFAVMDSDVLPEFDRKMVKASFQKVEVFRDGHILPHFAEEGAREMLKKYWMEMQEEGGMPLWEEETVQ
ncbi:MAG: recombinase family protein [Lachnospiraceae bacterium]|nr:recombinase family protein [Lachnospiraceae bacterium]